MLPCRSGVGLTNPHKCDKVNPMKFKHLIFLFALLLLTQNAYAFWVWTPQTNKWVNPKYSVKDTPAEQLEYAKSFYDRKEYPKAISECEKLIKYYPLSREAAEAQHYIGLSLEGRGAFFEAFRAYQKVIDKYPFSDLSPKIIEEQYNLGIRMLEGEGARSKFWGAVVGGEYEVVQIFKAVIKNAPYGPYAAVSQYKIGLFLQEKGLYQEARDEFEKVMNDYPSSEWAKAAQYQIALVDAKRSSDAPYDQRTTKEAIEGFKQYLDANPEADLSEKAKNQINDLKNKEAENNYLIGRFYEKKKAFDSAKIYYTTVVEDYKQTPWAVKALERLRTLEIKRK